MTERKVILSKSQDWDTWISYIRMLATTSQTWELIDPSLPEKPSYMKKPVAPVLPAESTNEAFNRYKMLCSKNKEDKSEFEKQQASFKEIIKYIQATISAENATLIQEVEAHPYEILLTLKRRLASTSSARELAIEQQYRKLCEGLRTQDVDKWLDEWIRCFDLAKEYRIAEIINEKRSVRDFLLAVDDLDSTFSGSKMDLLDNATMNIHTIIEEFRNRIRLRKTKKSAPASHSAFPVAETKESSKDSNKRPSFRGKSIEPAKCICGKKHWYSNCFYLNQKKRPSGWKADPEIQEKVQNAMKEKDFKAKVDRSLKRNNEIEKKKNSGGENGNNSSNSSDDEDEKMDYAFAVIDDSVFSSSSSKTSSSKSKSLRSSWILDHTATTHVCNNTMAHRFIKDRDGDGRFVTAGGDRYTIQSYGHIVIKHQGEFEIGEMTLLNVSYIPEFMANLVSGHILYKKGVHLMTETGRMYRNGKTFGYAIKKNGLYYIEDHDDEDQESESKDQDADSENEIFDQKDLNLATDH